MTSFGNIDGEYIIKDRTVLYRADDLIEEKITLLYQNGNYYNAQNGDRMAINKDGYVVPFVNGSGTIPGVFGKASKPSGNPPLFVQASLNTKIQQIKECDCGGCIEDCEGNQCCGQCGKFYGMTK